MTLSPTRRLLVPGSARLPDPEPTVSAEDPDGPKLLTPVCWDFPVPGMYTNLDVHKEMGNSCEPWPGSLRWK